MSNPIEHALQWIANPAFFTAKAAEIRRDEHARGVWHRMPSARRGLVIVLSVVAIFAAGILVGALIL